MRAARASRLHEAGRLRCRHARGLDVRVQRRVNQNECMQVPTQPLDRRVDRIKVRLAPNSAKRTRGRPQFGIRADNGRSRAAYILCANRDGGVLDFDQWGCWVWFRFSGRKGEPNLSLHPCPGSDATASPHVLKSVPSRFKELQGKIVVL